MEAQVACEGELLTKIKGAIGNTSDFKNAASTSSSQASALKQNITKDMAKQTAKIWNFVSSVAATETVPLEVF